MTSEEMLGDDEMAALLSMVARDETQAFPNRTQLWAAMLDASEAAGHPGAGSSGGHLHVLSELGAERRSGKHLADDRQLWFRAAAAIVALAGALLWMRSVLDSQPATVDVAADRSLVAEHEARPVPIAAGVHRTEAVGDGITLDVPAGIEVIEERPGVVVLGRTDDRSEPRATVMVLDAATSLEAVVDQLEFEGLIRPVSSIETTTNGPTPSWDLRITNKASEAFDCEVAGPCVPMEEVFLWSRGVNQAVEILGPEGQRIWWIEQSSRYLDPLMAQAPAILGTVTFG